MRAFVVTLLVVALVCCGVLADPIIHFEDLTEVETPSYHDDAPQAKHFTFYPDDEPETSSSSSSHSRTRRATIVNELFANQPYPPLTNESEIVGDLRSYVRPGTPEYDAFAEINSPNVYFTPTTLSSQPKLCIERVRNNVNKLADLVRNSFGSGVTLCVLSGYLVAPANETSRDLRYAGRKVHLSITSSTIAAPTKNLNNLKNLADLAWDAGFDWLFVRYTVAADNVTITAAYIEASSVPDSCGADLDLVFLLDGSGSITQAGYTAEKNFALTVASYFTLAADRTRVGVVTVAGPRSTNLAPYANGTNCPPGTVWEANNQGCICAFGVKCTGLMYDPSINGSYGCREGKAELSTNACANFSQPGFVLADHPDCKYPVWFFDHTCQQHGQCQCETPGPIYGMMDAVTVNSQLGATFDLSELNNTVSTAVFPNGGTQLSYGLKYVRQNVFDPSKGLVRPDAEGIPRVLVVITDGKSNYGFEPKNESKLLHEMGVIVFALGVGDYYEPEMLDMASDVKSRHIMKLTSASVLSTIVDRLSYASCQINSVVDPGDPVIDDVPEDEYKYFTTKCDYTVQNFIIQEKDIHGSSNVYVSFHTSNPSPLNFDFADTSSNPVKTIYATRNVSDTQAPVYVAVEGKNSSNTFQLTFSQGVFSSFNLVVGVSEAVTVGSVAVAAGNMSTVPGYSPVYHYSLDAAGNEDGTFTIDSTTGAISLLKGLDFESNKTQYTLTRRAVDQTVLCLTGFQTITVNVLDANDNKPVFDKTLYTFTIDEMPNFTPSRRRQVVNVGSVFIQVHASDKDASSSLSYFFQSSPDPHFGINNVTGDISLLQPLDYETKNFYDLVVNARDQGGFTADTPAHVQISVFNVFEVNVTTNGTLPPVNVTNPGVNDTIVIIPVDPGTNGTVFNCSLPSSYDAALFYVVATATACELHIKNVTGDINTNVTIVIGTNGTSVNVTVPVDVTVNKNPPVFDQTGYAAKVALNEPVGSRVVSPVVTDADGDHPVCSIVSGNNLGIFEIDSSTCVILVKKVPQDNGATKSTVVSLKIQATDGRFVTNNTVDITFYQGCSPIPCVAGFSCASAVSASYACTCLSGHNPPCQNQVDFCANQGSSPCIHQGVCVNGNSGYTCDCPNWTTGSFCENVIDQCSSKPCVNGTCMRISNGTVALNAYNCSCNIGWYGYNCDKVDTSVNMCSPNPCSNGGSCSRISTDGTGKLNGYKCTCPTGYFGTNCTETTTKCTIQYTCLNGGVCTPTIDGGKCTCNGYYGDKCQFVDDSDDACASNPCKHGGSCTRVPLYLNGPYEGYECACVLPYKGDTCQLSVAKCQPGTANQCLNSGTCVATQNGGFCDCNVGCFSGDKCQTPGGCAAASSSKSGASSGLLIGLIVAGIILLVLALLLLLLYHRRKGQRAPVIAAKNATFMNPGFGVDSQDDAMFNPMYGMSSAGQRDTVYGGAQGNYDTVGNMGGNYDSTGNLLMKDGGYMAFNSAGPMREGPDGASNPLYGQNQGDDGYAAVPNNFGRDGRNFSVERGNLRLQSVSRNNPLMGARGPNEESSTDGTSNPMYGQNEGGKGPNIYDRGGAPPVLMDNYFTVGEATQNQSPYDQAGLKNGSSPYDQAGVKKGSSPYDQAGVKPNSPEYAQGGMKNNASPYDAAGGKPRQGANSVGNPEYLQQGPEYAAPDQRKGSSSTYDAANGKPGTPQYAQGGLKNGSSPYDKAGVKKEESPYHQAGVPKGMSMYDAAGLGVNAKNNESPYNLAGGVTVNSQGVYDQAGSFSVPMGHYDQVGPSTRSENPYDQAGGINAAPSRTYDQAGGINAAPSRTYDQAGGINANPSRNYDQVGGMSNPEYGRDNGITARNGSSYDNHPVPYDLAGRK